MSWEGKLDLGELTSLFQGHHLSGVGVAQSTSRVLLLVGAKVGTSKREMTTIGFQSLKVQEKTLFLRVLQHYMTLSEDL